ncbi:hypothetical protein GOBAR_AA01931 [Gossypium barbadense]|uniref:non-specific serine/threonine protein kinase n=1 Tax=Gossypium barbadense TaxID=3634 RepID=A0A2P5YSS3_GOSBA|nr:hypothetical protein GOBAR_AA01931 [Gossypium barbadense]
MGISKKHLEVIILLSCFNLQGPNLLGLATATTVIRGNDTDQQALLHFKAKISGDRLKVMESWNSSIHFCQWHGITCGRKHQRVTKLELQVLELSGSLSPYIGNLSFLKELNLATNNFYDHIPQEVGHLRRLESLRGSIPPALGNLSSLEELYLTYNAFSGVLPEALGRLTNLTHFSADENSISGIIPTAMFNLSNIIVFSIGGNKIQGTLHSDLAITMPHVGAFSLWGNQIYGKIPISISNASNLYQLQLDENRLSGNVPSLEKLENLFVLNLYTNHLGHGIQGDLDFVCTLVNNTKLEILSIQNNNFGGVFPKCIRNFSRTFSVLGIEQNNILGRIPDGIGNLNNLEVLRASQNQLSGPIPFDIGRLKKLKKFYIDSNFLSGTIPHSIGNLTLLIELALDVNKLKGNIPSSLGDCQNLVRMTLSHNNLSGSIPPQVLALSSLSILLNLSSNYLTGELSAEVEKLKNLGELDVSKNRLSGLLPNNLGSCVSLEELFLDGNLFEGPIPSSLSSLRGLAALDVSENNLSGKVPEFLASFGALKYLNLSFNDFEGVIPSEGVFKNSSATFVEGNNKLCGGITELHLSRCNSEKSSNTSLRLKFVIVAVILGVTLIFLFLLIMLLRKKKEQQPTTTCAENSLLRLSYQSILRATNGFSTQNLVGLGGFGSVYRGILEETGEVIAVKVLNLLNHGASRSFLAECEVLKNIRHRNLVKLLTTISGVDYQGNDFKALVYEFMVNGSLEDWLHPPAGTNEPKTIRNLNLFQRLNMAIDVAHALEYLHHHCEILIIHCDLKPSNILLDEEMVAHISDFGLAKILSADKLNYSASQSSSLGLRGTVGYAPPEYGMGSELSTKGDVYSYGILLLEMFTGKRPTDEIFEEGLSLHNFVKTTLPERMTEIIDPILLQEKVRQGTKKDFILSGNIIENDRCLQCMNSILEIGLTCCTELPSERVDMCDVVTELCSIRDQIYLTQLGGLC